MLPIGTLHFNDGVEALPDTIQTILLTGGSSAQAMDWGSTQAQIARITPLTTAGAIFAVFVDLRSTRAAVPSSGTSTSGSTAGSTGLSQPVIHGARTFQIPGASTGWSIASYSSGLAIVEQWRK